MRCFVLVVLLCFHQALGRWVSACWKCDAIGVFRYVPVLVNVPAKLPRQDFIGSWIQSSEWFPIEINIPDTISAIGSGLSTGFMNFSDAFGNWIQGLPFFNRFVAHSPQKPYAQHVWMVPMPVRRGVQFNPYDGMDNNIVPMYP